MQTPRRQWTATEVLAELERHQPWLRGRGVRVLGLFGSYRHATPRPDSDLDFLVDLEQPSFDCYMDVKLWLEDTFGRPVDLVLMESIKPRLRPVILREVVYAEGLSPL
ncbi:nucleotidyltransferase domain-containing protein [Candidatus Chloroploca sp. M-50]|uniref:Nucleotidyltransferase domain-containing protein n=1 Tax=Candidatus Chloroploca mongolica TaxID=2528176 RepID=A0ABS4DHD3_9CHLR|nr:nucleotidyltransferase domain-containing protein [Candidatus Chloroploca mongolica]